MLKKLVTGQLSLPMTFWGWGFCGGLLIGLMGLAGIHTGYAMLVPLSYIVKTILFSAVLSGITFILRRKITVLGVLAFFVALIQVIMGIVMFVGLSSLLFK
ncbi:hypothetical protein [Lelliottia amnigena]|uniref:hypothetical protein n=1 Tax=Lelliottia amnigena TaxID=61646 RepID=UPI00192C9E74|nr:hypothetical protein [Lelliottia amnigena]MBL5928886.1 hypothetical protein [Lelliottia amnigena]MEA9393990.1 hypothetical protein [Lelliottia amnigena]QXB22779.1 hypothetical protein I6L76_05470 [Lelliottia amnigena]